MFLLVRGGKVHRLRGEESETSVCTHLFGWPSSADDWWWLANRRTSFASVDSQLGRLHGPDCHGELTWPLGTDGASAATQPAWRQQKRQPLEEPGQDRRPAAKDEEETLK